MGLCKSAPTKQFHAVKEQEMMMDNDEVKIMRVKETSM